MFVSSFFGSDGGGVEGGGVVIIAIVLSRKIDLCYSSWGNIG